METVKEFSVRQPNGKLKYFIEYVCVCKKIFTTRKDSGAKSCGCINWSTNGKRRRGKHLNSLEDRTKKAKLDASKIVYKHRYNDGDITYELFMTMSQKNCFYCGIEPSNRMHLGHTNEGQKRIYHRTNKAGERYRVDHCYSTLPEEAAFIYNGLDRIDQRKPHDINNVVTCCKTCNWMKRDMSQEDFLSHNKRITEWTHSSNN